MGFTPFQIVGVWVRGLLSILLLILGPYLLYQWYQRAHVVRYRQVPTTSVAASQSSDPPGVATTTERPGDRVFSPDWGFNRQTALLALVLGTTLWALPKGPKLSLRRLRRRPGPDEPRSVRTGEVHRIERPDGSAHSSAESSGFSGNETRGQLDFVAGYTPRTSPAVTARGMLGMLRYDATDTLGTIRVPTLIITGDKDPVCKPQASERMRAEIASSELVQFSPAKHEGLLEHHEKFGQATTAFVRSCASTGVVPG